MAESFDDLYKKYGAKPSESRLSSKGRKKLALVAIVVVAISVVLFIVLDTFFHTDRTLEEVLLNAEAVETHDISLCNKLDPIGQTICERRVAIINENASQCPKDSLFEDCAAKAHALGLRNSSTCESISNEFGRGNCYEIYALVTEDADACEKTVTLPYGPSFGCYEDLAIIKGDNRLCDKIVEYSEKYYEKDLASGNTTKTEALKKNFELQKQRCVITSSHEPTECEKLPYSPLKATCYFYSALFSRNISLCNNLLKEDNATEYFRQECMRAIENNVSLRTMTLMNII